MTALPQQEKALVGDIRAVIEALGWSIRPEVHARWFLGGSDKPKRRRVDLYCRAPKSWRWYAKVPVIVIEAKDQAGLSDVRIGREQAIAAMSAFDFQVGKERDEAPEDDKVEAAIRPSVSLLVTRASWETGTHLLRNPGAETLKLAPELRNVDPVAALRMHALGEERTLWEHGCAVLWGPDPHFVCNLAGFNQRTLYLGDMR